MRSLLLILLAGAAMPAVAAKAQLSAISGLADSFGVPGAAWAIVRDGEVMELGASGSMDGARPVDPSSSVFRVASISKVVTAVVAARLAARGEIDLDADLRGSVRWLDERFHDGGPMTLRQLLTHTSGLDDRLDGMLAQTADEIEDAGEHLQRRLPHRTTTPGRYIRYSNYGIALAGYVLAERAGLSFDDLARREVFGPLRMGHSTFGQPIPDSLLGRLARAYPCADFRCEPRPVDYRQTPPAGALVTTAADMGRLVAAVVSNGLGAEATRILTARSFSQHPAIPGIALALQEQTLAGHRALVHAGTSSGYRALMVIVPDENAGLFLVASGGGAEFGSRAMQLFERTLTPVLPQHSTTPRPATESEIAEYGGSYLLTRAPRGTIERFPGLFAFGTRIGFDGDGYLVRNEGNVRRRYGLAGPDLFRSLQGPERIAFARNGGQVSAMYAADEFFGVRLPASYERIPGWRSPYVVNEVLSWLVALPMIALALWLLLGTGRVLASRLFGYRPGRRMSPAAGLAAGITTGIVLLYGFGFMARLNRLALLAPEELGYGLPPSLSGFMPLAWLIPGFAVIALMLAVRRGPIADRVLLAVTGLAAAVFSVLLVYFNLLPPAR